jgi:hypothetical protein
MPHAGTAVYDIPPAAPKGYTQYPLRIRPLIQPCGSDGDRQCNVHFQAQSTIITKIFFAEGGRQRPGQMKNHTIKKRVTLNSPFLQFAYPGDARLNKQKVKRRLRQSISYRVQ